MCNLIVETIKENTAVFDLGWENVDRPNLCVFTDGLESTCVV